MCQLSTLGLRTCLIISHRYLLSKSFMGTILEEWSETDSLTLAEECLSDDLPFVDVLTTWLFGVKRVPGLILLHNRVNSLKPWLICGM